MKDYLKSNQNTALLFVAAGIIALLLRYKLFPALSENPLPTLLGDPDSAYYLRLFDLAIASIPHMPSSSDYYTSYPWGLKHVIAPIWPYALAMLSLPLALVAGIEPFRVAGLLVLMLSVAIAVPVYFLARELFGRSVAVVSAFFMLFLPYFYNQRVLSFDHHLLDVFLLTAAFALVFMAQRHFAAGATAKFVTYGAACGVLITLSLMSSLSLILIVAMLLLALLVALFTLPKDALRPLLATAGSVFGVSALAMGLFYVATPWFSNSLEFSRLSILHVALLGTVSVAFGAAFAVLRIAPKLLIFRIAAGTVVVAAAVAMLAKPELSQLLVKGYLRSVGSYPLGVITVELHPLFEFGLQRPIEYFSYAVFLAPLALGIVALKAWRAQELGFEQIFFFVMFLALAFYTVQARYYGLYLSIFIVIAYGLLVAWIAESLYEKVQGSQTGSLSLNAWTAALTAFISVIMLFSAVQAKPVTVNPNLLNLAEYIKTTTEPPGDFLDSTQKPPYGVLVDWANSFQLGYFSQRAIVSTGNHETGINGIIASIRFYNATSQQEALKIARSVNARYVVGDESIYVWEGRLSQIGEPAWNPDSVARAITITNANVNVLYPTMAGSLLKITSDKVASLGNFRLIYISAVDPNHSPYALFEVVRGAQITVKAEPNSTVTTWTRINYNNQLILPWKIQGQTNSQGVFTASVPYPTNFAGGQGAIAIAEPYRVAVGNKEQTVEVSERDIVGGGKVALSF